MFTVVVPPLRPARLTPEEDEPFAFALGAKIGEGAFSTVYALSAPSTSMAAKVILKEGLAMAAHVEQVVQEMRVLRALRHPNIVRYIHCDILGDHHIHFIAKPVTVSSANRSPYLKPRVCTLQHPSVPGCS